MNGDIYMKKKIISTILYIMLSCELVLPVNASIFISEMQIEEDAFSTGVEEEDTSGVSISSEKADQPVAQTDADASVVNVEIIKEPNKVNYYYGLEAHSKYSFDVTGTQVKIFYSDGTTQILEYLNDYDELSDNLDNSFSYYFENPDGSEIDTEAEFLDIGDYLLTIEYDENNNVSDATTVHVVEPLNIPELVLEEENTYKARVSTSGNFPCAKFIPAESGMYKCFLDGMDYPNVKVFNSDFGYEDNLLDAKAGHVYYLVPYDDYKENSVIQFCAKKAPAIKDIEVIKEPDGKFLYEPVKEIYLAGTILKVIYSDGTTETIETGIEDITKYGDEIKFSTNPDGTNKELKVGTYDVYVFAGTPDVKAVIKNVKIKSFKEMPLIEEKGEILFSTYGKWSMYTRLRTGKKTKYLIQSSLHKETVAVMELGSKGYGDKAILVHEGEVCTLKPNTTYILALYSTGPLPSKAGFIVTPSSKSYSFYDTKISGGKRFAYTGKPIKPTYTVKYGNKTLKKNKDYSVYYYNNTEIGTGKVYLKGKGLYSGTMEMYFKIQLKTPSLKVAKSGNKGIIISWSKSTGATQYIVERSTGKKWSEIVTVKERSFVDNKVKRGTTYKYRVRACCKVNNEKSYSSYSSVKSIKR